MALFPKKIKFRKSQRGRENPKKERVATRGNKISFGSFGLKAQENKEIKVNQIESARKVMARFFKKSGKMWIRVFADKPVTAKPPEVGMGKGKGDPAGFVARVRPGAILFEIDGLDEKTSREVLRKASAKLPVKTKIVSR
ncbi:50S ribosomal protein L16 [Candidatus Parcubacteria bacterium]|nr:50S ribosomal protein L16 [Patescibacteria group bacterium]MBU4477177.1 50S ribosomal protein L16 [Patescibacteria group bacterium]MCG2699011.1 50S ribosomal protein L16 [Candidatus Parcubacteria bacterium]